MNVLRSIGMGMCMLVLLAQSPVATACACKCADLDRCLDKCQKRFADPILQTACYGGCSIACAWHGGS